MQQVKFFDPGKAYLAIKPEIDAAIQRVLTAGDLILRDDVERFEKDLAAYVGTNYAVGLNSGTDALLLALMAYRVGEGHKVLVPSHTFVATAQVVRQLGAEPVLYDMDYKIDWTQSYEAIIPAHIAGEIMMPSIPDGMWVEPLVVEDACQALGATEDGRKAGSLGQAGAFSFYPAKILGAYGDAGALVTNDKDIYEEVKELRNHYKKDYSKWGINSRLDNLQAAVLNVKLKYLPETLRRRAQIAEKYLELEDLEKAGKLMLPEYSEGRVWQDYILQLNTPGQREGLYGYLKANGIETMKNEYPMPLGKLPLAADYEARTLRLPINEILTDEEIDYVIKKIHDFFSA